MSRENAPTAREVHMALQSADAFNQLAAACLPGHVGVVIKSLDASAVHAEMAVAPFVMAPNGYMHAGSVVTLADTAAGFGCRAHLPDGATGFTTIELKSNHIGTAREGTVDCIAKPVHLGRTTQLWDAVVTHRETGRTLALFRCTQMILYGKPAG